MEMDYSLKKLPIFQVLLVYSGEIDKKRIYSLLFIRKNQLTLFPLVFYEQFHVREKVLYSKHLST